MLSSSCLLAILGMHTLMSNQQYYEALASSTIVNKQGLNSMWNTHSHTHVPKLTISYVIYSLLRVFIWRYKPVAWAVFTWLKHRYIWAHWFFKKQVKAPWNTADHFTTLTKISPHWRTLLKQVDLDCNSMKWSHVGRMLLHFTKIKCSVFFVFHPCTYIVENIKTK